MIALIIILAVLVWMALGFFGWYLVVRDDEFLTSVDRRMLLICMAFGLLALALCFGLVFFEPKGNSGDTHNPFYRNK